MSDFISFYRPAECRAAIALARERSGSTQSNVDAKRAALVGEGNKVTRGGMCIFSHYRRKLIQNYNDTLHRMFAHGSTVYLVVITAVSCAVTCSRIAWTAN